MQPDQPPPPPAAWAGTAAQYHAAMNAAGFTWDPRNRWWAYRAAGITREHPQEEPGAA